MDEIFFDKSEKGKEELTTRKYQLPSKLRPLLVMVDGKQSASVLLKKVLGLGLTEDSFAILLEQGFIVQRANELSPSTVQAEVMPGPAKVIPVPETKTRVLATMTPARSLALKNFFNETIKSKLGLRGFGLQLKVERADSIADFLVLGDTLIESIQKSKGGDIARQVQLELDTLLYDVVD